MVGQSGLTSISQAPQELARTARKMRESMECMGARMRTHVLMFSGKENLLSWYLDDSKTGLYASSQTLE